MTLGLRKMGYGSWILHMVLLLLILTPISLFYTHFLMMGDSFNAEKFFNTHDLQQVHGGRRENHIEKVSGEVGKQENGPLFLENFRILLGVKFFKFNQRRRPFDGDVQYGSPSPSPLPSIEAPAPAPVHPVHVHSHAPWRRHRWIPSPPKIHKEERDNNGRTKRILVAVLVSVGATSILSLVGLFWGCRKYRKQRKRSSTSMVAMYSSEGAGARSKSKFVNSQNSVKKVTSDPGPDLFYLESLGTALEPHSLCLKQNTETANKSLNQNKLWALNEVEEPKKKELMKIEFEEGSSSAVGEIVSVHDSVESVECEAVNSSSPSREKMTPVESHYSSDDESIKYEDVEKVIPVEDHESFDVESIKNDVDIRIPLEAHYSSDDESFHSLCNSHSSNPRLSNASIGSVSDKSEIVSPNLSRASTFSAPPPVKLVIPSPSPVPPPPPPSPPLPSVHISPSYSTSSSARIKYKASSFSALPNLSSSPRNSDSSSGSNQTPKSNLPLSFPNPPGPPGEIPPPPLPPPFTKGSINSSKGPPPPPPLFPQHTPLGKDGSPLPKLKPLHWDKVRAASNCSMVWDKLKSSSFEFDEQMIESLFGYNLQNSMKNEEAKSKSTSPSKHVLEPKRLQNITILSKALNVTAEQVCHALIQGNGLCLQQLEALSKMEPTKEEETKLTSYKGNSNELGSAEKFVTAMLKIPYAFQRIEAMLYRETFEDEIVHLRKSFSMLEEACKELRSSRLFLKLLEAVLKTGNRMNVGTIRGGARAFKLDTLLKLSDVKGTDGKTTLLHFVVQEIVRSEGIRVSESIIGKINQKSRSSVEDKEEDYRRMGLDLVAGLTTELCNVKKTATIDLDVLASSVSNLSDGMTKLQCLITKDSSMDEKSGNFAHSMKAFLIYAERNLKELRQDEHKVMLHVREITEYFHGNVSKEEANPLRIFVIVRDFLGMLDHVCRELRSLKVPSNSNPLAPFR